MPSPTAAPVPFLFLFSVFFPAFPSWGLWGIPFRMPLGQAGFGFQIPYIVPPLFQTLPLTDFSPSNRSSPGQTSTRSVLTCVLPRFPPPPTLSPLDCLSALQSGHSSSFFFVRLPLRRCFFPFFPSFPLWPPFFVFSISFLYVASLWQVGRYFFFSLTSSRSMGRLFLPSTFPEQFHSFSIR